MSNLRQMVDGIGSLALNVSPVKQKHNFQARQEVIIRRPIANASRGNTTELIVGRILAVGNGRATVSVPRPGGITQRVEVSTKDLQPVTESFRRSSLQFSPSYLGRM